MMCLHDLPEWQLAAAAGSGVQQQMLGLHLEVSLQPSMDKTIWDPSSCVQGRPGNALLRLEGSPARGSRFHSIMHCVQHEAKISGLIAFLGHLTSQSCCNMPGSSCSKPQCLLPGAEGTLKFTTIVFTPLKCLQCRHGMGANSLQVPWVTPKRYWICWRNGRCPAASLFLP